MRDAGKNTAGEARARARSRGIFGRDAATTHGRHVAQDAKARGRHAWVGRERESQVEDESKMATSSRTKNPGEATDDKKIKKPKRGRTTGMILLRWHVVCTRKVVRDGRLRPC